MSETPVLDIANLFTCLSCSFAFLSAEDQRLHYRSDHHRYNMKRRVAGLPPVSATLFSQKVQERQANTALESSLKGSVCEACRKTYTTENAYRSHLNSKKHKEAELKATVQPKDSSKEAPSKKDPISPLQTINNHTNTFDQESGSVEVPTAVSSQLSPTTNCLFCPNSSASLEDNLTHMSKAHSFFIPDSEYLVDLPGLLSYLCETIALNHVCIFCISKGRDFRSLDAVRKHMNDKGHCKMAYDDELERLTVSDFYDFTTSYPEKISRETHREGSQSLGATEEWEDVDSEGDSEDNDEIVNEEDFDDGDDHSSIDSDLLSDNQLTYGDSPYELILPSGARIGHRNMRRYYAQSLTRPLATQGSQDPNSGAALVRKLLADRNSALVPRKGGFGAFGQGTDVVKARNRGEAREAGRHIREFRDQSRREHFKTLVGFKNNHQKHFRDPLLQ